MLDGVQRNVQSVSLENVKLFISSYLRTYYIFRWITLWLTYFFTCFNVVVDNRESSNRKQRLWQLQWQRSKPSPYVLKVQTNIGDRKQVSTAKSNHLHTFHRASYKYDNFYHGFWCFELRQKVLFLWWLEPLSKKPPDTYEELRHVNVSSGLVGQVDGMSRISRYFGSFPAKYRMERGTDFISARYS